MVLILDRAGTRMGEEIINMADSGAAAVLIIYYWKIVSIISLEWVLVVIITFEGQKVIPPSDVHFVSLPRYGAT